MDPKHPRGREPEERWFTGDEAMATPPVNQRRERRERPERPAWRPSKKLTVLLLAVFGLMILALAYLRDEPAPWDDDLRRPAYVPQGQDVSAPARMKAMLLAGSQVSAADPAVASPWSEDVAKVGALLDRHAPVLDNLRDLLEEKPDEWEPRSLLWKIENLAADPAWPGVLAVKEAECAYLSRRGHEEPALLSACDLVVLGALLERLDAWPEFADRALQMHEHGTQTLARLLARTHLPEPKLRHLQEVEFNAWAPSVQRLNEAMEGFYNFERKLLLGPEGDEPPLPLWYLPARSGSRIFFKPNATLRLFAESFRELKNESGRTAFTRANQVESRLLSRGLNGGANRSGEDYFATRIRAYASLLDRNALARTRHAIVLTLFAMHRFVQAEQRLPLQLEELMPRYLPTPPLDSFSGEPLRYDPKRGLIWSVGLNFRDEGGHLTEIPMADPDEPTVETGIGMAKAGK